MRIERLVAMVNDISAFFDAESDRAEAARGVANHIRRFWDPRMRRQMIGHYRDGGAGLKDLARDAVQLLAADN